MEIPAYAKICGIMALIMAVLGVLIPIVGVLILTPIAIILGILALYGGYKGMGIATLILVAINLVISPTFWVNIAIQTTNEGATINRFLTYFNLLGLFVMLYLVPKKNKIASD
jgi:hypothetical protein